MAAAPHFTNWFSAGDSKQHISFSYDRKVCFSFNQTAVEITVFNPVDIYHFLWEAHIGNAMCVLMQQQQLYGTDAGCCMAILCAQQKQSL